MISPYDAGFLFVFKAQRRAHSWDSVTEAVIGKLKTQPEQCTLKPYAKAENGVVFLLRRTLR